nr:hypothetical protein CFP56_08094 [Quercus suber]
MTGAAAPSDHDRSGRDGIRLQLIGEMAMRTCVAAKEFRRDANPTGNRRTACATRAGWWRRGLKGKMSSLEPSPLGVWGAKTRATCRSAHDQNLLPRRPPGNATLLYLTSRSCVVATTSTLPIVVPPAVPGLRTVRYSRHRSLTDRAARACIPFTNRQCQALCTALRASVLQLSGSGPGGCG